MLAGGEGLGCKSSFQVILQESSFGMYNNRLSRRKKYLTLAEEFGVGCFLFLLHGPKIAHLPCLDNVYG